MKRFWFIREPALGIVVLAVLALVAGTVGMWAFQHRAELDELHERLTRDCDEMVRQFEIFDGSSSQDRFNEKFIPLDLKQRLLQVRSEQGNLLYRSPRLANVFTVDQGTGTYLDTSGDYHRFEVFRPGGLLVHVNADLDPDDNFIHETGGGLIVAVPAMFIIIFVGGLWLRDRALRPVQRVRDDVSKITAQSLDRPLPEPAASAEVTDLVSTLNVTLKSLSSSFEQATRFSADASHQLKTPLAVLRLGVEEMLIDKKTPALQRMRLDELLHQIHRLTAVVEKLLLLSRVDAGSLALEPQKLDANELLSTFLDDLSTLAEEKLITLEIEISADRPILADRESVTISLENLMENAIKYNRPGGRIKVTVDQTDRWTDIMIANTALPIPPERTAHIFQRFFRASGGEETPGHGLGLSIARALAELNQGKLELISSDDQWTVFRLRLPNAEPTGLHVEPVLSR